MHSIVLLGSGNVAHHLFDAFSKVNSVTITQVYGRTEASLAHFNKKCSVTTNPSQIQDATVYLLAVNDDAIIEVSGLVKNKKGLVCHTSGAVSLKNLITARKGVFYPLQSFTKNQGIDFKNIPICVEAETNTDILLLQEIASTISNNVHAINSDQRRKLHLAAVFVNNFTNHLFQKGAEICQQEGLSFELLKPLIQETVDKLHDLAPKAAQTGPARRNDTNTMQRHLDELKHPLDKKLYQLLSESIKNTYEKEL